MQANLYALGAIALWASLAALGVSLTHIPPFLLTGVALIIGSVPAWPFVLRDPAQWRVPLRTLALGVYGLFAYHFLLFIARKFFIAHDLSVIRHISDRVAVMYLGRIMEIAETDELFNNWKHPYTEALLSAIPNFSQQQEERQQRIILEGEIPSPINPPSGCPFRTRCFKKKGTICETSFPPLVDLGGGHRVSCWWYGE